MLMAGKHEQLRADQDSDMSSDEAEAAAELDFPGSESENASSEHFPNQLFEPVVLACQHTTCMHASQPALMTRPVHLDYHS